MFKPNLKYSLSYPDHLHEPTVQVEEYPENNLPKVFASTDFGDCEIVVSDIYDLFSQERINNLGPDVVRDFLSRNLPMSSPVSEAISKMSDDEIITSIRSRHIQQPSELLAWSKYVAGLINDSIDNATSDVTPSSDDSPVSSDEK